MTDPRIAKLDAAIAKKEAELAKKQAKLNRLKRQRRALVAGQASGEARSPSPAAQRLRAKYAAREPAGRHYGLIRRLAQEVGLSERQAHRILRDLKPKDPW